MQKEALITREAERINFQTEAVVARRITRTEDGRFIDVERGIRADGMLDRFSKLKFGHMPSVRFFAHELAESAMHNEHFLDFLAKASESGKTVFITSPGVYNVPSASNLLLKETAVLINATCSKLGIPPVKIAEQTRLGESGLDYASRTIVERANGSSSGSVTPEMFKDQAVIFLDDVYISGTVAERTKTRLIEDTGVNSTFFLFGMQVDPEVVRLTEGKVEDWLNKFTVDGSLESLDCVIKEEFIPTQKTLRDFLSVENRAGLRDHLETLDAEKIMILYLSATQNGFRERWQGMFAESVDILEKHLRGKGYVNVLGEVQSAAARLISKSESEIPAEKAVGKVAAWHIDHINDLPVDVARLYSRMKYSDPEATAQLAVIFADRIWNDPLLRDRLVSGGRVMISSSAYGAVPTAAGILVNYIAEELRLRGANIETFKIDWQGDFGVTDYGTMTPEKRASCLAKYKTFVSPENMEKIRGNFVLIVDDLSATGSHEKKIGKIMDETEVEAFAFCVLVDFSEQLAFEAPNTEEKLNHFDSIKLIDLAERFRQAEADGLEVTLNTRTVRYILDQANDNREAYDAFLDSISRELALEFYRAAVSGDGYGRIPKFMKGIQILENRLLVDGLIDLETVGRRKGRTAVYTVSFDDAGHMVDMRTGENLDEIGRAYSLMKFGSAREIDFFAKRIAEAYIARLDNPVDDLLPKMRQIEEAGEYIVHSVAGSRNVESAAEFLYDKAIKLINVELALRGLPTIIPVHSTRLEVIAGEYAAMQTTDRTSLPKTTHHILPGTELFENGVHLLYGDDVRITGTTADRVERTAVGNGASSFSDMYAVLVDPKIAFSKPEIESILNKMAIEGSLDDSVKYILNQAEFRPVQRFLRVLFDERNLLALEAFMENEVIPESVLKLYIAALNNDYLKDKRYSQAVEILKIVLQKKGLVDSKGRLI